MELERLARVPLFVLPLDEGRPEAIEGAPRAAQPARGDLGAQCGEEGRLVPAMPSRVPWQAGCDDRRGGMAGRMSW
jgi:hypothetical protein